jgi:hypothetical protein
VAAVFTDDVIQTIDGNPDIVNARIAPGKSTANGKQHVLGFWAGFVLANDTKTETSNYQLNGNIVSGDFKFILPYATIGGGFEASVQGDRIKAMTLNFKTYTADPSAKPFTDASANALIAPRPGLIMGEIKRIGDGVAQSWLKLDDAGKPTALGVIITGSSLQNLSSIPLQPYSLTLPSQAELSAIKSLSFDWYGTGLPGAAAVLKVPVAAVPLFLLHAYLMTPEEAKAISPADPQFMVKGMKSIPPENIHPDYNIMAGGPVPGNGTHILDAKGPLYKTEPLRTAVDYGYFDGRWTTIEPIFTRSLMESKTDLSEKLKLPAVYPKSGLYYPTTYSLKYDATNKEYIIAFEGLILR